MVTTVDGRPAFRITDPDDCALVALAEELRAAVGVPDMPIVADRGYPDGHQ